MSDRASSERYDKPWLSVDDQLNRLQHRGLVVEDRQSAARFIGHLGYYRFSGYCLAFEQSRHRFADGTTFADVEASYRFDVDLRDAITDALEIIEVDLRSTIAHSFSRQLGPFGHLERDHFRRADRHAAWLNRIREEAERSREPFILHYRQKYREFPDLPFWIATEIMTFGSLSRAVEYMKNPYQKAIAQQYGFHNAVFDSILHHLCYIRNLCAHHSRLWDREWAVHPRLPDARLWHPPTVPNSRRLYITLLLIYRLLQKCSGCQDDAKAWRSRVTERIDTAPNTPRALELMGLHDDWHKHPYWV